MLDARCGPQAGHILLEALIGCALAVSTSAGLWQLATVARQLAQRAIIRTDAQCVTPACTPFSSGFICECGRDSFTIVR
jgi:hypothetical protein